MSTIIKTENNDNLFYLRPRTPRLQDVVFVWDSSVLMIRIMRLSIDDDDGDHENRLAGAIAEQ